MNRHHSLVCNKALHLLCSKFFSKGKSLYWYGTKSNIWIYLRRKLRWVEMKGKLLFDDNLAGVAAKFTNWLY